MEGKTSRGIDQTNQSHLTNKKQTVKKKVKENKTKTKTWNQLCLKFVSIITERVFIKLMCGKFMGKNPPYSKSKSIKN